MEGLQQGMMTRNKFILIVKIGRNVVEMNFLLIHIIFIPVFLDEFFPTFPEIYVYIILFNCVPPCFAKFDAVSRFYHGSSWHIRYTVEPVYTGHPRDWSKMAVTYK